jgi:diketogulonate reductase-like aldo/keto reductase
MASVENLLTRAIPSTGESIPVIGLGTWQTFEIGANAAASRGRSAHVRGLWRPADRFVADVPMYGRAEEVVGEAIS